MQVSEKAEYEYCMTNTKSMKATEKDSSPFYENIEQQRFTSLLINLHCSLPGSRPSLLQRWRADVFCRAAFLIFWQKYFAAQKVK